MANFDGNLTPTAGLDNVPQASTQMLLLGGAGGPLNAQAQALLNRIEYVRSDLNAFKTTQNKRIAVFGTNTEATDVANLRAAYASAPDNSVIDLFGEFKTNDTITVKPTIATDGARAKIVHTNAEKSLFVYDVGSPDGYPGRISFNRMRIDGPGNTGNNYAIKIDANAPFCKVTNSIIAGFKVPVFLKDTYCSAIEDCYFAVCSHGIQLFREAHATVIKNVLVDLFTVAGLSVNYGSGAGTGPTHNISVIGGGYQNGPDGVWLEQTLGFHSSNTYHEGNTHSDFRIGVADGGAYQRACYGTVIDGFDSASPCAGGTNIIIEHSVGVQVRAASWNTGCSTTNTLLRFDGYSDRIDVDIFRYTTTTPTATAPVDFTVAPDRGVLRYRGKYIFGDNDTAAIQFGNLATIYGALYKGYTPGGRDAITLRSYVKDLQLRAPDLIRMQDNAGNDLLQVDALNNRVLALKSLQMSGQTVGTTVGAAGGASALPATPLGYWTTVINGVTVKVPYYNQ